MPCPSFCPSLAVPRSVTPCYARKEFLFRKIFPLDRPNIWNGRIVDYRAPEVVDPKKKYWLPTETWSLGFSASRKSTFCGSELIISETKYIPGQQEAASFEADSRCMKQTRGSGKFLQGEYKAREPRKPDCFEDYMYDTVDQSGRRYYRLRRADRILQDGAFCAQVKTV